MKARKRRWALRKRMAKYYSKWEKALGRWRALRLSLVNRQIHPKAEIIHSHLYGTDKIAIGERSWLYYCRVRVSSHSKYIHIGARTKVECNAFLNAHKGYITIGSRCFVGPNVIIQGFGGVEIGNHVMIAGNTFISSSNHIFEGVPADEFLDREEGAKVVIHDDVWIGSNVTITAGVEIGPRCVIGAGSVVTRSIPAGSVAVGAPAKVVKSIPL